MNIIYYFVGLLVGVIATCIWFRPNKTSGTLWIDRSDPLKDVYSIELNNLEALSKKKIFSVKIKESPINSQK